MGALASLGAMAAGCGGLDDLAGVGSGGTGQIASFSLGAISGFGSVIVNGIRYDDSSATVTDDLGDTRGPGQLRIGMVVEIDGDTDDASAAGVARSIRIVSEIRGRVGTVNAAAGQLMVQGLAVQTSVDTVWDDPSGINAIGINDIVEVWGFADRTSGQGVIMATRIDASPSERSVAKLRGIVDAVSSSPPGLRVGAQPVDLMKTGLPAGLAVGALVQVMGPMPTGSGGPWTADRVSLLTPALSTGVAAARLEGKISGFQSAASFQLAGLSVDASSASFQGGSAATLRDGLRIRVDGRTNGANRVNAERVSIRDDGAGGGTGEDEAQVKGGILRFNGLADFSVVDRAGRVFRIDGSRAAFESGTSSADLKVGVSVEVKGRRGAVLQARLIKVAR